MPELDLDKLFESSANSSHETKMDWLKIDPGINEFNPAKGMEDYLVEDAVRILEPQGQFNIRTLLVSAAYCKLAQARTAYISSGDSEAEKYAKAYLSGNELVDPLKVEGRKIITTLNEGEGKLRLSSNGYYFYRHHLADYEAYVAARDHLLLLSNRLFAIAEIPLFPEYNLDNAVVLKPS